MMKVMGDGRWEGRLTGDLRECVKCDVNGWNGVNMNE